MPSGLECFVSQNVALDRGCFHLNPCPSIPLEGLLGLPQYTPNLPYGEPACPGYWSLMIWIESLVYFLKLWLASLSNAHGLPGAETTCFVKFILLWSWVTTGSFKAFFPNCLLTDTVGTGSGAL